MQAEELKERSWVKSMEERVEDRLGADSTSKVKVTEFLCSTFRGDLSERVM